MFDQAIAYARQGLRVFPLQPGGKTPLVSGGFHAATTDEEQIAAWWQQQPAANVGIATGRVSGIVVVDVDRHGEDGVASLKTLELPPTRAVKTPRNGYHLYFRYPESGDIGRLIGVLPGIDLLGDNGYVVACGSSIDEKLYELLRDRDMAPCPSKLLELSQRKPKANGGATPGQKIGEGKRNDYLASVAGILRRSGFEADAIEAALQVENTSKCYPPLPAEEVALIARSIARYESEHSLDPDAVVATAEREKRLGELAKLSPVEYDQQRTEAAAALGVRASTLDAEVKARREQKEGGALMLADPEPWPDPVDGAGLLTQLRQEFERYVVLPAHGATAAALWTLHTWCVESFFISPYLFAKSPQKRCGKSTLMMVLRELTRRPLMATSASPAAIFRCVEKYRPTLLLDEADAWLKEADELRGILNGGHSKRTAWVLRTVGDEHEPYLFATFCPKAFSGIGRLVDTLEDRSIIIPMARKRLEDKVARLREDHLDLATWRRQCLRWVTDNAAGLKDFDPPTPGALNDRAADNWRCLLAIADLAGGDWPKDARAAAVALSAAEEDEAIGTQLLADIRAVFDRMDIDQPLSSATLAETLGAMAERPWSEWKGSKPITQRQLAALLKPFGVRTKNVRLSEKATPKGYDRGQFEDAFARYLPGDVQSATPPQQHENQHESVVSIRHTTSATSATPPQVPVGRGAVAVRGGSAVADENGEKCLKNKTCGAVADEKPREEVPRKYVERI